MFNSPSISSPTDAPLLVVPFADSEVLVSWLLGAFSTGVKSIVNSCTGTCTSTYNYKELILYKYCLIHHSTYSVDVKGEGTCFFLGYVFFLYENVP